jgi:hypothetical protein
LPKGSHNKGKGKVVTWLREHVNHEGLNCLKYPFHIDPKVGYALFSVDGEFQYAHRWMCAQKNGPPPSEKSEAAHTCGNAHMGCINPNHLVWKDRKGNAEDRLRHGNYSNMKGRRRFRLTPDDVATIRALKGIESQYVLAERFGVSRCSISSIHTGLMYSSQKQTALRAEQVQSILSAKGSRPAKELAAENGVHYGTIYRIWNSQSHQSYITQQLKEEL